MLRSLTERRPVGCLRVPRTRRPGTYPRKTPLPKCFGGNACPAWARAREVQWRLRSAAMLPQEPQCLAAPCAASSAWWCAAREARGLPGAPRGGPCLAQDSHCSPTFWSGEDRQRRHMRLAKKLLAEEPGWCGPSLTWVASKRRMSFDPLTRFSVYSLTSGFLPLSILTLLF